MTSRGLKEEDFVRIADFIDRGFLSDIILKGNKRNNAGIHIWQQ